MTNPELRPRNATSHILGLEIGRDLLRGVVLDAYANEIVAIAECRLESAIKGLVSAGDFADAVEQVSAQLAIGDRAALVTGVTIGPKHSGVGSGEKFDSWIDEQVNTIRSPMAYAGQLGKAYAPLRAIDNVAAVMAEAGYNLRRVDLAPVAACRLITDLNHDTIVVGSGLGWRAKLRNFEVLEAIEHKSVSFDDPFQIVETNGNTRPYERYTGVKVSAEVMGRTRADLAQLGPAVGAAFGILKNSGANLLESQVVSPVETAETRRPTAKQALQNPGRSVGRAVEKVTGAVLANRDKAPRRGALTPERPRSTDRGTAQPELSPDDPIYLFSPETDMEQVLESNELRGPSSVLLVSLAVLAAILAAAYFFV